VKQETKRREYILNSEEREHKSSGLCRWQSRHCQMYKNSRRFQANNFHNLESHDLLDRQARRRFGNIPFGEERLFENESNGPIKMNSNFNLEQFKNPPKDDSKLKKKDCHSQYFEVQQSE
jgi:hypothetical protein